MILLQFTVYITVLQVSAVVHIQGIQLIFILIHKNTFVTNYYILLNYNYNNTQTFNFIFTTIFHKDFSTEIRQDYHSPIFFLQTSKC